MDTHLYTRFTLPSLCLLCLGIRPIAVDLVLVNSTRKVQRSLKD